MIAAIYFGLLYGAYAAAATAMHVACGHTLRRTLVVHAVALASAAVLGVAVYAGW